MKRNLKNFNHWISELRDIAYKTELVAINDDENIPISNTQKNDLFNKSAFEDAFNEGLSPQEAFDEEMDRWEDAL